MALLYFTDAEDGNRTVDVSPAAKTDHLNQSWRQFSFKTWNLGFTSAKLADFFGSVLFFTCDVRRRAQLWFLHKVYTDSAEEAVIQHGMECAVMFYHTVRIFSCPPPGGPALIYKPSHQIQMCRVVTDEANQLIPSLPGLESWLWQTEIWTSLVQTNLLQGLLG